MTTETLSEWLELQMKEKGWRPADLARIAGISQGTLSNILNGSRGAGTEVCVSLAQALEVPPENVLRLAGILPSLPPEVEEEREAVGILRRLSDQVRASAMAMLRALGGGQPSAPANEPPQTYQHEPEPRTFRERMAAQLARELEGMPPDDVDRVFDLMKRLRDGRQTDRQEAADTRNVPGA